MNPIWLERPPKVLLVGNLPERALDRVKAEVGPELVLGPPEGIIEVDAIIAASASALGIAELRRRFPSQPILATTSRSAEERERLLLLEAGADSVTPSNGDVVAAHLRALLRRAAWRQ